MLKGLASLFSGGKDKGNCTKDERKQADNLIAKAFVESASIRTESIDPDEHAKAPKGAEISYLDAKALNFWDGKKTDYEISNYYSGSAFGRNVGPALTRLIRGGYLQLSSIEKNISLKTVPELKAILAEHELKTSGKKAELIYRLTSSLSEQELQGIFPVGVYEITSKGENALKPYSIVFANDSLSTGFPYYRLMKERESDPLSNDVDILLRMMKQDLADAGKSRDQEKYRIKAMETGNLLRGLGRPEEAIEYYCLSFFMFWQRNTFELKVNNTYAYEYDAKRIDRCGQECGYSLGKTLEIFEKVIRKHNPFSYGTSRNIAAAQNAFKKALSV